MLTGLLQTIAKLVGVDGYFFSGVSGGESLLQRALPGILR
jgi:hypothetical protein